MAIETTHSETDPGRAAPSADDADGTRSWPGAGTLRRRLIRRALAYLVLSAITLAGVALIRQALATGLVTASTVNLTGRQRALVTRIGLDAVQLVAAESRPTRQQHRSALRADIGRVTEVHEQIVRASADQPELQSILFEPPYELDRAVESYAEAASALASAPSSELSRDDPRLAYLLGEVQGSLYEGLEALVAHFEQRANASRTQLRQLDSWLLYGTGAGLLLGGLLAVRPLVTEIRQTQSTLEEVVAERTEEHERFFELSIDLLCTTDLEGHFRELNPAWETTLGYPIEALRGRPFLELVHPDDRAATVAEFDQLRQGARTLSFENRYRTKDGEYRWLLWSSAPGLETERIYAVARDITDRKAEQAQLRSRNLALEERVGEQTAALDTAVSELRDFTYTVAHDLRAPARAITGFASIVLEEHASTLEPEAERYVRRMRDSGVEMGALVDGLLAFARVGRVPLARRAVDPAPVAQRAWDALAREHDHPEAELTLDPLPACHADPDLLEEALRHLLDNALKFQPPGSTAHVKIDAAVEGDRIVYQIRDDGIGVDMRYADQAFDIFQRLHVREGYAGAGVGLAIVKRIIERNDGAVSVQSEPSKGTSVFISLPAARTEQRGDSA